MLEATLVLGAVAAVGLVVLLAAVLTTPAMIMLALGVLLLGLVVEVPTGFWYDIVLYRIVSARIAVPRRWWVSPSALHPHLTDAGQRRVRLWYRLGGIGFVLSVAGGLGGHRRLAAGAVNAPRNLVPNLVRITAQPGSVRGNRTTRLDFHDTARLARRLLLPRR